MYRKMLIIFRIQESISPQNQKSKTYITFQPHMKARMSIWITLKSAIPVSISDTATQPSSIGHTGQIRPQGTWHPSLKQILLTPWLQTLDLANRTMGWHSGELDSSSRNSILRFWIVLTREMWRLYSIVVKLGVCFTYLVALLVQ